MQHRKFMFCDLYQIESEGNLPVAFNKNLLENPMLFIYTVVWCQAERFIFQQRPSVWKWENPWVSYGRLLNPNMLVPKSGPEPCRASQERLESGELCHLQSQLVDLECFCLVECRKLSG